MPKFEGGCLADNPEPPEGFHRGKHHRLRLGPYRLLYVIDDDVITVERSTKCDVFAEGRRASNSWPALYMCDPWD
jgi:hypothetical protein